MRAKILVSAALAALVASFAVAPKPAHARGDIVAVKDSYMPGTIVIRTNERALYYFVGVGQAIRYPVGVGRLGMQWSGTAMIDGKYIRPAWSPPDSIRRRLPLASAGDPGRLAEKSDGRRRHDPLRRRPIRHPRHQQ